MDDGSYSVMKGVDYNSGGRFYEYVVVVVVLGERELVCTRKKDQRVG